MKRKVVFFLTHIEEIVAGGCLAVMVGVTFVNTIGRYFFGKPLTWGDELSMILAAWATFLGMSAAYKRNQHLGMEFLLNRLSGKKRLLLQRFITLAMVGINAVLMVVAWQYAASANKRTAIMRIPYQYVYASAAVGFTLMTAYTLFYLYQSFFQQEAFMKRLSNQEDGNGLGPTEEESK